MGQQADLEIFLLFHSLILRKVFFSFASVLPAAKMGTMCLLIYITRSCDELQFLKLYVLKKAPSLKH